MGWLITHKRTFLGQIQNIMASSLLKKALSSQRNLGSIFDDISNNSIRFGVVSRAHIAPLIVQLMAE